MSYDGQLNSCTINTHTHTVTHKHIASHLYTDTHLRCAPLLGRGGGWLRLSLAVSLEALWGEGEGTYSGLQQRAAQLMQQRCFGPNARLLLHFVYESLAQVASLSSLPI
jgi:hypothetical protein